VFSSGLLSQFQELLGLVETRLGGMRRSAERALGAAQALSAAEAAYARALGIVSGIPLAGDADAPPLRAALKAFRRLPEAVGAVHSEASEVFFRKKEFVISTLPPLQAALVAFRRLPVVVAPCTLRQAFL